MPPANHTVIVCPVYNDWQSLQLLLEQFQRLAEANPSQRLSFVVVNDGSEDKRAPHPFPLAIRFIHLHRNLGHQKAIAIGLSYVSEQLPCDQVIVMDADGEDQPEDVLKLLMTSSKQPGKIIFAKRRQRRETKSYQLFYSLYKTVFHLLTGRSISFGNFLLLPYNALQRAVHYSEIWNNIPSGLLRTKLPLRCMA
jgi:polyisoprenyl-phosphate glycosyltransferase